MKNKLTKCVATLMIYLIPVLAFNLIINTALASDMDMPENEYYDLEWILPPENYRVTAFSEGRAWVKEKEDGPWTLYDEGGNVIKSGFKADGVSQFRDGVAVFWEETDPNTRFQGFVDLSGDIVIPLGFYGGFANFYGDGLIRKQDPEEYLYGYVNFAGEWVIPPKYRSSGTFQEGIAQVGEKLDGKVGLIDKEGNVITEYIFDGVDNFHNGTAVFKLDSLYGLIDKKGNYVLEPTYSIVYPYPVEAELIAVVKNDKVGFIDRKGNVAIDFIFRHRQRRIPGYYRFYKGRALVLLDEPGKEIIPAIIDTSGKIVLRLDEKTTRSYFDAFNGDFISLRDMRNRYCIIDRDGRTVELPQIIQSEYTISVSENNIFSVSRFWTSGAELGNTRPGFGGYFKLIPKGGN